MIHTRLLVEKKRESLKHGLADLAQQVGLALEQSLEAVRSQDLALAREIVAGDASINFARRALEQEALLGLAAYQPAGPDLRSIAASMEMVGEIERIVDWIRAHPEAAAPGVALSWIAHNYERVADRATNIAERVVYIATGEVADLD